MCCPKCDSESVVKCGKDKNGFQRFACKSCKVRFTESHAMAGRRTSVADTAKLMAMLLEGMSIRSCELWAAKKAARMTQEELGMLMGYRQAMARKSVSQFLKTNDPRISMLRKFAKAVGVSLTDIIGA